MLDKSVEARVPQIGATPTPLDLRTEPTATAAYLAQELPACPTSKSPTVVVP